MKTKITLGACPPGFVDVNGTCVASGVNYPAQSVSQVNTQMLLIAGAAVLALILLIKKR